MAKDQAARNRLHDPLTSNHWCCGEIKDGGPCGKRIGQKSPGYLDHWPWNSVTGRQSNRKDISMHDAFFAAGKSWELGPDWPGQRCGAKTRRGTPCQNPAMAGKGRCCNHGGKSTGARTAAGLAKLEALHLKHGRFTKAAKAEAKRRAQIGREIRAELRDIEREAIASGTLGKGWRDQFNV